MPVEAAVDSLHRLLHEDDGRDGNSGCSTSRILCMGYCVSSRVERLRLLKTSSALTSPVIGNTELLGT